MHFHGIGTLPPLRLTPRMCTGRHFSMQSRQPDMKYRTGLYVAGRDFHLPRPLAMIVVVPRKCVAPTGLRPEHWLGARQTAPCSREGRENPE